MADAVAIPPSLDEAQRLSMTPPHVTAGAGGAGVRPRRQVWAGTVQLGGACVPGLRLTVPSGSGGGGGVFDALPPQAHAAVVSVVPATMAVGALLNARNEAELTPGGGRCTALTGRFIRGWQRAGATLLLRVGSVQLLARVRGARHWVADCATVRELPADAVRALDAAAFRKLHLGVVGRGAVLLPPDCVAQLPVLQLAPDGALRRPQAPPPHEHWVDEKSFGAAMRRFDISRKARPVGPGLRPTVHHSDVAALERNALKRHDALRKRPRSATPATLTDSAPLSSLPRSASASASLAAPAPPAAAARNSPMLVNPAAADADCLALTNPAASAPLLALGNPGASAALLAPAAPVRPRSDPALTLRMVRMSRLQRNAAARAAAQAAAAQKTRPAAAATAAEHARRRSLDGECARLAPRPPPRKAKVPDACYVRAIDQAGTFLDCQVAATQDVTSLAKLLVPSQVVEERAACLPAHNVEFASDRVDARDAALFRYEQQVGRTEMEHGCAWDRVTRGDGARLRTIEASLGHLTPGLIKGVFNWRQDGTLMVRPAPLLPQLQPQPQPQRRRGARLPSYMRAALAAQGGASISKS